ncbi:hypothetical protein HF882_00880 [Victivallis vadensis]|uniref:F5/8 type C domain-containing protein n=1 Tax=Victivallis vadensis TaxID=172901 RepID=A0A848AU41_9BACT|nr:discoidin domain-containing protein [Victivallis vadensis]NMD85130.1 hypothetical protein [Victivallis vadensis]
MNHIQILSIFLFVWITFTMRGQSVETGLEWRFGIPKYLSGWEIRDSNQIKFTSKSVSFISGRDSSFVSPKLEVLAARFMICEIVMQSDRQTVGELFFAGPDAEFSQKNSLAFQVESSTVPRTYRIDCSRHPLWTGNIVRLRLDPAVSADIGMQVQSIRLLPAKTEQLSADYVGMPSAEQQDDTSFRQPTLIGVPQDSPEFFTKFHNQLSNNTPISDLKPRTTREIPDGNIFGVAICGSDFFTNTPETKGALWSSYWLNDGEKLANTHNTVFSSAMHYSENAKEWCMVELKQQEQISRIILRPRNRDLDGFPIDLHILCSSDGQNWNQITELKEIYTLPKEQEYFSFDFQPQPTRFVKVVATRLRAEGKQRYYFQLRELEVFGKDGVNYALADQGGVASAGNPLGSGMFDYQEYYGNIFDSGAQWVFVSNESFLSRYKSGQSPCTYAERSNAEYLQKNGTKLLYRFFTLPSFAEYRAEPERIRREYAEAVTAIVKTLQGKVSIWSLANEQNFYGDSILPSELAEFRNYYVDLVGTAAERIRQIDPRTPIEIETALFDYGWTEEVLKAGLADKIDLIGVHVYKELRGCDTFPEAAGAISQNGKRLYTGPYSNYEDQIAALRKLIEKYNPKIGITVSETGINTGDNPEGGSYYVSEKSQAKFLARLYVYHLFHRIGPTCWWSFDPVKTGEFQWGLLTPTGKRKAAWYALRNVASIFDNSCHLNSEIKLQLEGKVEAFQSCILQNATGEFLIPFWSAVKMRDSNTGKAVDLIISGLELKYMEAIDMLSGSVHPLHFEQQGKEYRLKGIIVRDYPVVLRLIR